jgi:hypothetical protein
MLATTNRTVRMKDRRASLGAWFSGGQLNWMSGEITF